MCYDNQHVRAFHLSNISPESPWVSFSLSDRRTSSGASQPVEGQSVSWWPFSVFSCPRGKMRGVEPSTARNILGRSWSLIRHPHSSISNTQSKSTWRYTYWKLNTPEPPTRQHQGAGPFADLQSHRECNFLREWLRSSWRVNNIPASHQGCEVHTPSQNCNSGVLHSAWRSTFSRLALGGQYLTQCRVVILKPISVPT